MNDLTRPDPTLLPCPFCGGEPTFQLHPAFGPRWFCDCGPEHAIFIGGKTPEEASTAWNRRVASACASAEPVAWMLTYMGEPHSFYKSKKEADFAAIPDSPVKVVFPLYASPAAPAEASGRLTNAQVRSLMQIAHTWAGPDENDSRSDDLEMALRAVRVAAPAEVPQTNDHLAAPVTGAVQGLDADDASHLRGDARLTHRQCLAVAYMAQKIAGVHCDFAKLIAAAPDAMPLSVTGPGSAATMEILGDILNGMDAAESEDEWMAPIFHEAHARWPASAITTEAAPVSSEPDGLDSSAPPSLQAVDNGGVTPSPEASAWLALVMGAAASIEDAANCLRDPDAKKQADGAAKHYREAAQKLMAAAGGQEVAECRHGIPPQYACDVCDRDTSGVPEVSTPLPLFALGMARQKWEGLQAEGYRMQRIEFAMSKDGKERRGSIDPWGKVLWHPDSLHTSDGGQQ
jgi:hypothetical protein